MYTEDKNEEKRNQSDKSKNKIVPIRFPYDESDDPVIDEFILRGLQEEADETERRMNADPELSKITAPDDQYDKIVARLKAMGVWQEEAEETSLDENTEDQSAAEDSDVNETDAANMDVTDVDVNETDVIDTNANATDAKNTDAEGRVPVPDDPYQMLSEKDREAIELGREVQARRNRKGKNKVRRIRFLKHCGVTAAALILVFGVSMNVGASRRLILRIWESAVDGLVSRTATDSVEEENVVEATVKESLAAMEEIEEATGIPGIYFNYWPEGMEYLQYEIQDEGMEATVFYSYGEAIIHLYMLNTDSESLSYYLTDSDAILIETIDTWKERKVEIWEINPGEENEQYRAEIYSNNYRYILYGYLPLEELHEILNGMDFLS